MTDSGMNLLDLTTRRGAGSSITTHRQMIKKVCHHRSIPRRHTYIDTAQKDTMPTICFTCGRRKQLIRVSHR